MAFSDTERSFPFEDGPGQYVSEDDWEAMASAWQDNGVHDHPGGTKLTIAPGPTRNTIKILPGAASINGFFFTLTSEKVLEVPVNMDTSGDRRDLVLLTLDRENNVIDPVLETGSVTGLPAGWDREVSIPLGEWRQMPENQTSDQRWGTAIDRRWFIGVRMRPFFNIPGLAPPAPVGGFGYDPETGDMYIGRLVNGNPQWVKYSPEDARIHEVVEEHLSNWTLPANQIDARIQNHFNQFEINTLSRFNVTRDTPGHITWESRAVGEGGPRFTMRANGRMEWSSGTGAAPDVSMFRSANNTLWVAGILRSDNIKYGQTSLTPIPNTPTAKTITGANVAGRDHVAFATLNSTTPNTAENISVWNANSSGVTVYVLRVNNVTTYFNWLVMGIN